MFIASLALIGCAVDAETTTTTAEPELSICDEWGAELSRTASPQELAAFEEDCGLDPWADPWSDPWSDPWGGGGGGGGGEPICGWDQYYVGDGLAYGATGEAAFRTASNEAMIHARRACETSGWICVGRTTGVARLVHQSASEACQRGDDDVWQCRNTATVTCTYSPRS